MTASLIIFDCDGTLVDSEGLHTAVTLSLFNEILGYEAYRADDHGEFFMGRSWPDICAMVTREHGRVLPGDIDARYVRETLRAMEEPGAVLACPQAHETLVELGRTHDLCVASNGERLVVLRALQATGLIAHFSEDTIFTKDQVSNPKPAPDLFLYACENMGYKPGHAVVIEDSVTGVKAGRAAGMRVLGYTGTAPDRNERSRALEQAHADRTIGNLREIGGLVAPSGRAVFTPGFG